MGFFSRSKGKDGATKVKSKKGAAQPTNETPPQPRWEDAWTRTSVEPEEVQELLRGCTLELKSRGMYLSNSSGYRLCTMPLPFFVALHGLIGFCSFGYAISPSTFQTNFRSKCGKNLYSTFLRWQPWNVWGDPCTGIEVDRTHGEL